MTSTEDIYDALLAFAEEELDWYSFSAFTNYSVEPGVTTWDVPAIGEVKLVAYHDYDRNKNYDDWNEDLWIVFDIDGVLYKATGTYTSYIGSDWQDSLDIVTAKVRQVYYYE